MLNNKKMENQLHLNVAFPTTKRATDFEPTNISIAAEYIFLENVFSPLVEMDQKGTLIPGVAEQIHWEGNNLVLEIRRDLKTQSGKSITAEDVIFSLKRLLLLSGNTHGNFKDLVCSGVEFTSIDQNCPGIKLDGNKVILSSEKRKAFLLPMLAAIDFAIILRSSVNPATLKIENYKETSGPYFVDEDKGNGHIKLKLNPNHFHASKDIAQTIDLIPITAQMKGESLKSLLEGKVDLITTVDIAKADEQIEFIKNNSGFENHITQKIRSHLLVFTEKGIKNLTDDERRFIAKKVRLAFHEIYAQSPGFEPRDEFFPSLGEGGLTDEQQAKVAELNQTEGHRLKNHFKLGLIRRGGIEQWSIPINNYLPEADCYFEDNAPDLKKGLKAEDTPEAFIVSTDTGFMEDISLISYSLNAGLLGLEKSERNTWLSDYMAMDEKADRLKKLKELHFTALAKPWIVPLMASPYSATVRKPWKIELSDLYANIQLWLIKMQ